MGDEQRRSGSSRTATVGTLDACSAGRVGREGRRYQDLYGALDGISHKVLTETLRRAERDGLVGRHLDEDRIETATL